MIRDHDFLSLCPEILEAVNGSRGLTLARFDTIEFQILVRGAVQSFEDRRSGVGVSPWDISDLGKSNFFWLGAGPFFLQPGHRAGEVFHHPPPGT